MGADEEPAEVFADLARDLCTLGADGVARRVMAVAPGLVPGCEDAAMCLLDRHGGVVPAAATSERAALADRLQHEAGEGLCLTAIRGVARTAPDLLGNDGGPIAEATGIRCMLGVPLVAGTDLLGALTLSCGTPYAFDARAVTTARILASHAAVALAGAAARRRGAELAEALQSSRVIGMALGVVMAQRRLTPEQAFDLLRRASQRQGRKVREVAADVVETGQVPVGARVR
ncbi:GAF and ANTAR domain-containing protein [Nucisporomicrobium flavum]|uniref:GAF and ANTAR domain-containing protein n=1 Tax=Nucisporomicrobium flavum TaxID=2785915 RepID=UPI0018F6A4F9|nr:GAF and ANTAR domain-containing protein [Nucisporomicrobium flavum]